MMGSTGWRLSSIVTVTGSVTPSVSYYGEKERKKERAQGGESQTRQREENEREKRNKRIKLENKTYKNIDENKFKYEKIILETKYKGIYYR